MDAVLSSAIILLISQYNIRIAMVQANLFGRWEIIKNSTDQVIFADAGYTRNCYEYGARHLGLR
jgi:hypothetical protein